MTLPNRARGWTFLPAILLVTLFQLANAEGTRTWEQSKFEDLSKGTAQGVALRSAGGLELAPAFKALVTTPSTYIWSVASDTEGILYAAAGSPARVYRISPGGESRAIFEPTELQVQALVVGKSGEIYAATNPDGKVYKLQRGASENTWTTAVYFDPGTKYIWDLALDPAGNLYVATGDHGEIFRVSPKGEHSVFFKSDETHIRVLELDPQGNIIAGSDGSGLVYRISPAGDAFVLYSAPKKEITALAIDKGGNIYAAAAGEKRPGTAQSFPSAPAPPPAPGPAVQSGIVITGVAPVGAGGVTFPAPGTGATGGSEVYRIAPDGSPARIWTSRDDLVYALAFDTRGRLLAGTGNRGHIFAINNEDDFTDLLKASATQVTAFAKAGSGGLYAATSNLGKIFLLNASPETQGSYESDVFDAHTFSRWGRAELRSTGNVELFARSGNVDNPDRNWSAWRKIDMQKDAQLGVPPARFVQWKAVLRSGDPAPRVDSVTLNYLPKNVAPDFDDVNVQVGVRYQSLPKPSPTDLSLAMAGGVGSARFDQPPPSIRDRDSIGVKWSVHDDNDDQMLYSVYYRGEGQTRWLLLKNELSDKFYSFDASLLPDGDYIIKVQATDAPSHSPDQALSSEKESARFTVDTTPPQIESLNAVMEGDKVRVTFRATDSFSSIKRAEYSIDASDWQFVEPVGQLSDSKVESYDFHASAPKPAGAASSEHVIVVRVYDRYDNMNAAKFVMRPR